MDDMKKRLFNGDMTQDEYNEKAQIINTAANANSLLPTKDDGKKLNSQEKANYIYSRVSEAVLNKQLQQLKEDKSRDVGKIGEGEDATKVEDPEITQIKKKIEKQIQYRSDILGTKGMYFADGERVDKKQFNEILSEEKNAKRDLRVENDEKTQARLDEFRKPKEAVVVEEETIEPPIEGLGELQEEAVVEPDRKPLEANLELARAQAAETNEEPLVAETQVEAVKEPSTVSSEGVSGSALKDVGKSVIGSDVDLDGEVGFVPPSKSFSAGFFFSGISFSSSTKVNFPLPVLTVALKVSLSSSGRSNKPGEQYNIKKRGAKHKR